MSEDAPVSDNLTLEEIEREFIYGSWSGKVTCKSEELSPQEAAAAFMEQDSDPGFFNLTEEGKDLDEDEEYNAILE